MLAARDRYIQWARGVQAGRPHSFTDAAVSGVALGLQRVTSLDTDAATWLAGITQCLAMSHPGIVQTQRPDWPPFLHAWATIAPDERAQRRVHINEARFERWLDAAHVDMHRWYDYTLGALGAMRGRPFDVRTLYDIAAACGPARDDPTDADAFRRLCAHQFYPNQPALTA